MAAAVAGCGSDPGTESDDEGTETETGTDTPESETETDSGGDPPTDLESNVTDGTFLSVDSADVRREAVAYDGIESVGDYEEVPAIDGYLLAVDFTEDGARSMEETFETLGVADSPDQFALSTHVDGETVFESAIDSDFAASVVSGEWGGRFAVSVDSEENVTRIQEIVSE